ncbi:hypothetical protein [Lactococcus lactis]|uniref:hypothetical protein n=1 Tax=Lactococcus lactis TaxID=1358 RepID=UPI000C9F8AF5|nr:hypothetical protein [Lactococcus lactis]AUS70619.1 hypothetical protein LLG50_11310 [Lactococcus lactis subsp. lactis]
MDVHSDFQQIMDTTANEQANRYVGQLNKRLNEAKDRDNIAYCEVARNVRTAQSTLSMLNQKLDSLDKKAKTVELNFGAVKFIIVGGFILISVADIALIWLFISVLYEFGWSHIWTMLNISYQPITWFVAFQTFIGIVLSLFLFILGVAFIFFPYFVFTMLVGKLPWKVKKITGIL